MLETDLKIFDGVLTAVDDENPVLNLEELLD